MVKKRKPTLPGTIIEEHYIKPLNLNKGDLAKSLHISRNTLYKLLKGRLNVTARMAVRLSKIFNTSPELWLNLQQNFDVWEAENDKSLQSESFRPVVPMAAHSHQR